MAARCRSSGLAMQPSERRGGKRLCHLLFKRCSTPPKKREALGHAAPLLSGAETGTVGTPVAAPLPRGASRTTADTSSHGTAPSPCPAPKGLLPSR